MAQGELTFVSLEDNHLGVLSPNDVHLFYYDVGIDSEMSNSFIYNWSNDVEAFKKKHNLVIDNCGSSSIPLEFEDNKVFFTVGDEDENNKAVALFRHLRNSFAHYNIGVSGEYYCIKDFRKDGKTVTMIGKIHKQLFKELLNVFFMQRAKAEENIDKYYCPDI